MVHHYGKRIHLILPEDFLNELDELRRDCGLSRSDYIRLALMEKMKRLTLTSRPNEWNPPLDPTEPFLGD
jgi:metal-responsive CopG/Arc/MetJ family transcriptional regulator